MKGHTLFLIFVIQIFPISSLYVIDTFGVGDLRFGETDDILPDFAALKTDVSLPEKFSICSSLSTIGRTAPTAFFELYNEQEKPWFTVTLNIRKGNLA